MNHSRNSLQWHFKIRSIQKKAGPALRLITLAGLFVILKMPGAAAQQTTFGVAMAADSVKAGPSKNEKKQERHDRRLQRINDSRYLAALLKEERLADSSTAKHNNRLFYYRLASTFAKLRLYPLAMKCYFKTLTFEDRPAVQGMSSPVTASLDGKQLITAQLAIHADTTMNTSQIENTHVLDINNSDINRLQADSGKVNGEDDVQSQPVGGEKMTDPFDDGKTAVAYALMVHVKQPVSGKRKVFHIIDVGHTFITLIKYNSDSSTVSRSFGFYPRKTFILQATPLVPSAPPTFKDDSLHNWDEISGNFISKKAFGRILNIIKKYEHRKYHLSNHNCTDFGLEIAAQAGIAIKNSKGSWPLGSGNNPAFTGQSLREGQVTVMPGSYTGTLFLVTDSLDVKR